MGVGETALFGGVGGGQEVISWDVVVEEERRSKVEGSVLIVSVMEGNGFELLYVMSGRAWSGKKGSEHLAGWRYSR